MIYGREELARTVARHEGSVLLITGDSGIGKTRVLQLARDLTENAVAPLPLTLVRSSGALRSAFLEQLGDALERMVSDGLGTRSLAERLADTGRRLTNERDAVIARVALAELVSLIRGRIGDEVGKAVTAYAKEIWPDTAETLAAKAAQTRDPLIVEILCAFAETTAQLASGARVVLSLDQGQRLAENDWRLLGDMGERLPAGVCLRVAYATDTIERTRAVAEIRADVSRVAEIEVQPLAGDAIAEWVVAEGLASELSPALARQTGGYPLLVEATITHLKAGGELGNMPRHEQLAIRTRASWNTLSSSASSAARKLAVLPDPLPESELRGLCGISDLGDWAAVVSELRAARIFSVEVNGQPWFHSERRAFVLSDCLTNAQRDEAASNAATYTWELGFQTIDSPAVARFAQLASLSPSYQRLGEPQLEAAVRLDGPELAVTASLLELGVGGQLIGDADAVFAHALSFVDEIPDPAEVLSQLEQEGLVTTAADEWATVITADWDPQTQAVIHGRSAFLLRRAAVPRLAEVVFHLVLGERLGLFSSARFGIGSPSIGALGRMAVGAEPHHGYINREKLGANLLVRGSLLDYVPFYCAVSYEDEHARDVAETAVTGLDSSTAIGIVKTQRVEAHPVAAVPIQRFVLALARARGAHHPGARDRGDIKLPPPDGVSDEELAEMRIRTAQLLSQLATPIERSAMDLDDGLLFVWEGGPERWDECIVSGAGWGHRREPALAEGWFRDHYESFRLRQSLGLTGRQPVIHRESSLGEGARRDPIAAEVGFRRGRAEIFNSAQLRLNVVLADDDLEPLIDAAFKEELADARTLHEQLQLTGDSNIGPRTLRLLVARGDPAAVRMPGARGSAYYREDPSTGDDDHVFVEMVQGDVEQSAITSFFSDATGARGNGSVDYVIARYLRHHPDDIRLVWPAEVRPSVTSP
jgi:hypothetical protein